MAMAKGMGVAEGAASDMSITLAGLSGDVASFYNLDQEDAAKKLQGVFTGESEALKSLGVVMTQTNLKQFALEKGMNANIEAMSQAELVALRYAFVTDALSLAAGDFERTQDSWANQTRILSMQWQQFTGTIGKSLTTVLTPTVKLLNQLVGVLNNVAQKIQTVVSQLFGNTAEQTQTIAKAATDGANAEKKLAQGVTAAGKAAKKSAAGFDELNTLQPGSEGKTETSTGSATSVVTESVTVDAEVKDNLSPQLQAVVDGIKRFIEPLKNINLEPAKKAFEGLRTALSNLGSTVGERLSWVWFNVLVPLGKWILETAAPAAIDALSFAFNGLQKAIEFVWPVEQGLQLKETMQAILVLVGLVGASILTWKILDAYTAGVSLSGILAKVVSTLKNVGSTALIVAGAMLLIKGYCDGWVNGIDWGNLLLALGGIAAILVGITIKFGSFGLTIGAVAASIALLVLGVKDFINNGPSVQNTIMIIGGAIAAAVALATAGLSVVIAAIVGAITAVVAFTAAILLEKTAIMDTKEAQENLTAAKEAATAAENDYISTVDAAESAMKRLQDAEKTAGITGAELYASVQNGTIDYANMTAAQKEVYKAYLDNEQKQKDLEVSTKALNEAKKAETLASLENEIALGKESGSYDKCKESILAAYNEGAISAEECRDLLAKSMSEMSTDAQKTFMEDIPGDIKDGLDPNQYETTRKKIGDWFSGIWKSIFNGAKAAFNGVMGIVENAINSIIKKINTLSWTIPDWVPFIGGGKFGFNFRQISIPRLAQGAVIPPNREFLAVLGDQKHGTNIEAPLSTIQEALANVLEDRGDGNITINFTGDLAQLARVLKPVIEKEGKRVGTGMVRKAGA